MRRMLSLFGVLHGTWDVVGVMVRVSSGLESVNKPSESDHAHVVAPVVCDPMVNMKLPLEPEIVYCEPLVGEVICAVGGDGRGVWFGVGDDVVGWPVGDVVARLVGLDGVVARRTSWSVALRWLAGSVAVTVTT